MALKQILCWRFNLSGVQKVEYKTQALSESGATSSQPCDFLGLTLPICKVEKIMAPGDGGEDGKGFRSGQCLILVGPSPSLPGGAQILLC